MHQLTPLTAQVHIYIFSCLVSDFRLVILELVLAPGVVISSSLLSWPQGTEFVDSFLRLFSFYWVSRRLSHDNWRFCQHIGDIPLGTLRQLATIDYRKSLAVERIVRDLYVEVKHSIFDTPGIVKASSHTIFRCIRTDKFHNRVPAFLSVRSEYEYHRSIN